MDHGLLSVLGGRDGDFLNTYIWKKVADARRVRSGDNSCLKEDVEDPFSWVMVTLALGQVYLEFMVFISFCVVWYWKKTKKKEPHQFAKFKRTNTKFYAETKEKKEEKRKKEI